MCKFRQINLKEPVPKPKLQKYFELEPIPEPQFEKKNKNRYLTGAYKIEKFQSLV